MVLLTRSLLSLIIVTSLACSSEHKSDSNSDAKPQTVSDQIKNVQSDDLTASVLNIADLQGRWALACVAGHEDIPGAVNSINFANRTMSYSSAIYIAALDCQGDPDYVAEVNGMVSNGQASLAIPGGRNIDVSDRRAKVTVNSDAGAASLNKQEKCGKTDWKKGDVFEPEVVLQPGSNDGKCYKVDSKFTVIKVANDQMQLGAEDTPYIAESADTRPVKLSEMMFGKVK